MRHTLEIIAALGLLTFFHLAFQALTRKVGRGVGKGVGMLVRPGARKLLTHYYLRKVSQQRQEQRVKNGIPPLENPHLE